MIGQWKKVETCGTRFCFLVSEIRGPVIYVKEYWHKPISGGTYKYTHYPHFELIGMCYETEVKDIESSDNFPYASEDGI